MTTTSTLAKHAATGSLLGLALGDALGFPTEFNDVPSILAKFGPWREMSLPRPAIVTDDTQMTLALGRGLRTAMDRGLLTPLRMERPVREEFVDWYQSPDNNRAPGRTCLVACNLLKTEGRPWQEASQIGSKGCGANMRVAPVGLVRGSATNSVRAPRSCRPRSPTAIPPRSPPLTSPRTPCGSSPEAPSRPN